MSRKTPEAPILTILGPCRIDLAIKALEEGIQLSKLDARTWRVSSGTQGTQGYYAITRDSADIAYICDCTAAANNLDCKHVALVQVIEATGAVVPILPPLPAGDVSWDQTPPRGY